ncbi:glycosyltransferase [Okeania sp. KiyG1]|uniref:glycosyltransferase n=1 Tax=Okeania sp. KiyG1 TaxID=2720165 RepID=UPI002101E56E|nr:glycosyltransferase [Okeania sp. KiyG1]
MKLNSAQDYRDLGDQLLKEGKLEESANNYRQALELQHNFWQVHHSLGDVLQKQGKLDDAVACYCQAININPHFFWSAYNLGNTLIRQGNLDRAIASYFYAAEIQPHNIDTYQKLADLLEKQDRVDEAQEYKLLVKNLKDNPVETCYNLGDKLVLEGKIEGAISCYQRALELKQDLWKVYGKLGNLLKEKGDLEEEIKLYNRVLKLNQKLPEIEANLQKALKEQENTKTVKKVEGIPDNFVIPSIVGEGNDYSFIEEKVKEFVESKKPYKLPVSMIIPTYNRKAILAKTLAAITHQTYPKHLIEVIVADDGSTDGVEEVILKYEKYLELIHVRQQDQGYRLCAVRNLGIRTSKHEHLILLDCDLIPEPQFVEELMKYLHVTDKAVLMAHRRFVNTDAITDDEIFEDINIALGLEDIVTENVMFKSDIKNKATIDWRFRIYEQTDNLKKEKYPFRAFASGHVAYSKNIIHKVGWYDEDFQEWGCEDIEFGYRVYNAGYYFIPVLTAIDLHQEPPGGSNETDRITGKQITQKLLEQKCPAGWYRKYRLGEIYEVPKVSIYIPAYNVEQFIKHTVDSVLNQTYTDLEVCICDDGSTDRTLEVLEENYSENPRVRWVSQPNGGIGKASNTAVKMCRGMYIGQLDSDDMLKPDAVETMVKYLDKYDVGCVYSCCERIDKYGNYVKPEYNWPEFSREKLMINMIIHHFRMFRKRDWMKTEGFAEDLFNAVDYDMYMKLSEVCSFHHINKVTYSRRIHGKNTSLLYEKEQDNNTITVINRSLDRLGLSDVWIVKRSDPNNPRKLEVCRQKIVTQNL